MRSIAITLFVAATLLPQAGFGEGTRLQGDALKGVIAGKAYTGRTSRGGTWKVVYSENGKMDVTVLNSDWADSGTWEIKDDKLCSERSKRAYACSEVMKVSDSELHFVDERRQTTKAYLAR